MKKLLACLIFACCVAVTFAQEKLPFTKGLNMLGWFAVWEENALPDLSRYDEADFACLKSMGVDVMRLTVHFDLLMEPAYTGRIYDSVLEKLDQVCDWAEKYQIYLVIDNHAFNTEQWDNNPPSVDYYVEHLKNAWSQVAPRYKDRSEYIIYEIVNEPKGTEEYRNKWAKKQQELIDLIREYDATRPIVVTSADWGNIDTLVKTKPYKDPNLIYTFHFYEPHIFTHQGASWVSDEVEDLEGLPFPYDKKRLPKLKGRTKNSWVQWEIENNYKIQGTEKFIDNRIKKVANWAKKNKVKIWCGEIGAKVWTNPVDRLAWIRATVSSLNKYDVPYCIWGIGGSDGFLKEDSETMIFPDDIDKEALEAYGFKMPDETLAAKCNSSLKQFPQKSYLVYDGYCGKGTSLNVYGSVRAVTLNDSHKECVTVTLPGKNNNGCNYTLPKIIWNKIANNKDSCSISMSVKFTNKNQKFSIGLNDSDEGEVALPWTREYEIRASDYKSGEWVNIELPLSKFYETGAWSNKTKKWYPSEGKFDWNRLELLQLYFNDFENAMSGEIYVDDIMIKKK